MIVESYEDVIVLSGSLRSNFWDTIHTAISLTLKRHPTGVIIDCSGIVEASAEGVETFRDAMDFIKEHDARIIVAAVPEQILDVLKTVPEVRSQLPIAASVGEARRSLDLLVEAPSKKKQAIPSTDEQVLVCLFGDEHDRAALHLGSKVADTLLARIVLLYVVLMPRDLPLQAPMPEDEELAVKAIEHGKSYLAGRNLSAVARLERGRDLASAVQEVANEVKISHVVVPLSPDPVKMEANQKLVRSVLEKVTQTVVFVRGQRK